MKIRGGLALLACCAIGLTGTTPVFAGISFSGISGNLAASATFDTAPLDATHGKLTVTLTNTSDSDVMVPADVLTAVFFDAGAYSFTPLSALLASGSTVFFGPDGGGNVGGEWAYLGGLSGAPHGASAGISSSGLSPLFGAANFNGPNLDGNSNGALAGLNFGILSAGDNTATGNQKVTGGVPLIKNSVVFTLSYFTASGFSLSAISNVSFQYGTALNEPNVQTLAIPAPAAVLLGLIGLIGLAGLGARLRHFV